LDTPDLEKKFLEELQQHQRLIHKVCRIYTHTAEDREDLFQEITIELWRGYPGFKGASKFSTWLYRVAINTAINRIRKKRPATEPLETGNYADFPVSEDDGADQLSHLYRAIGQLNEIEKSIVMLYLDDNSYAEMEEILGIREGALRVRMNRIKEKIRTLTQDINHGTR
jgi:RNA polymerase sigma factor (sigma-70 family)